MCINVSNPPSGVRVVCVHVSHAQKERLEKRFMMNLSQLIISYVCFAKNVKPGSCTSAANVHLLFDG